jgi:fatty acid desaturase
MEIESDIEEETVGVEKPRTWSRGSYLDHATLKALSKPSTLIWCGVAAREWAIIFGLMWLCNRWSHPLLWVTSVVLIGSRQHALAVLVHDAGHYLAHRSKRWNDWLANYFAAYPLYAPVQGYRTNHLAHHRLLETPIDPERLTVEAFPREFTFPMPKRRLYWLLFRDVVGGSVKPFATLVDYVWAAPEGKAWHMWRIVALHAAVIGAVIYCGQLHTYLLLWVLPMFTTFLLFFRLRTVAEHSGVCPPEQRYTREFVDPLATTRTMIGGPLARLLLSPYNISYHTEHHIYPSVPGFRLKQLHALLLENKDFARRVHVTRNFPGLVAELTATELPAGERQPAL